MNILTVVGARPQFIKAATVSRAVKDRDDQTAEVIVHTGQHYDDNMSAVFFDELDIPEPDYNLGIGSAPHGEQTGRMMEAIEKVTIDESPDAMLVYGDTNSTIAGALVASKLHVPVAHVEAGLRSFNRRMPEEVNRILTDHASDLLFAPTDTAMGNLEAEGLSGRAVRVGDVMYDAAVYYAERTDMSDLLAETLGETPESFILATIHRAENTDDENRLRIIFEALTSVASDVPVVLPLHPRTRKVLNNRGMLRAVQDSIVLIDPVGYLQMIALEQAAAAIVTDSGGVQKEAYFHGAPCVTLRDETEWTELVDVGCNVVVPPHSAEAVIEAIHTAVSEPFTAPPGLYGDGNSAGMILDHIAAKYI